MHLLRAQRLLLALALPWPSLALADAGIGIEHVDTPADQSQPACYGAGGRLLGRDYVPCAPTDLRHAACCPSTEMCLPSGLCLDIAALLAHGQPQQSLGIGGCTDVTLGDSQCPHYCQHTLEGGRRPVLRYCADMGSWCCSTRPTGDADCCTDPFPLHVVRATGDGNDQQLLARQDGNPFGTFTIVTQPPAATSASTTSSATTPDEATSATSKSTAATSAATSKTGTSKTSSTASGSLAHATSSADASGSPDSSSADTTREALIAGLSVVSAIAAVAVLALVAALIYIRRLSNRNKQLTPADASRPPAAAVPPQTPYGNTTTDPYETMTVHNATPVAARASMISNLSALGHELSPIREQSEGSGNGPQSRGNQSGMSGLSNISGRLSRSSAELQAYDYPPELVNWSGGMGGGGGVNGGILVAELPENSLPRK